jgi:hypothetical protein
MNHSRSHGGTGGGSAGLSDLLSNYDAKEITHQEKTPGIKKEVVSFNSFSQL